MATVRVTRIGRSQKGKPIVYFDNKHGQTDGYLVSEKCQVPPDQSTIEAKTSSWDYQGKTFWGLNDWSFTKGQAIPVSPPERSTPTQAPSGGWDIQSGDLSRYASNIVASAITAGLIKSPTEINLWARAAYLTGQNLRQGYVDVYQPSGPDPSTHADDPGREEGDPGFDDSVVPF